MPTLKEIKGRISSVKSTLKITSAMKLVSSAKLRKAQKAIEAMRPYEETLRHMLEIVASSEPIPASPGANDSLFAPGSLENGLPSANEPHFAPGGAAIVAIASNSSLCGGFNANVMAKVRSVRRTGDVVYSVGRKMAEAMRKDGFPSPQDFTQLSEHPAYGPVAALVDRLAEDMAAGRFSQVLLVYTHFVSTAKQVPVVEVLMSAEGKDSLSVAFARTGSRSDAEERESFPSADENVLIEPGRKELLEILEPKVVKLKLYAALLDSAAAEHAARTVAMQTATDNGENLLQELTLQYNKGRQQKITSEILDLAGGQVE